MTFYLTTFFDLASHPLYLWTCGLCAIPFIVAFFASPLTWAMPYPDPDYLEPTQ